jgi:hypothetical protein
LNWYENLSDGLCFGFQVQHLEKGRLLAAALLSCFFGLVLGSAHISSRSNLLAQKRACCVENARKVFNLAALFALQARFCAQNLTHG